MGSYRGKYEEQRVGVDKVKPWVEVAKKAAPKQILLPYRLFQFALQQRLLQSHG